MKKAILVVFMIILVFSLCACTQQEKDYTLTVYLDVGMTQPEERSIGTELNCIEAVQEAVYISGEETLQEFLEHHESESAFSGLEMILPGHYSVTVKTADLDAVIQQIEAIEGVDKVMTPEEIDLVQAIGNWLRSKILG